MTSIVAKGMGIAVLVIFFIVAGICSFWYDDITFGNFKYMKWLYLYTGIIASLMSLAIFTQEAIVVESG
ncbi:MAG: hypothetical protein ACI857_001497 [Arenicella sp.]|jgi:hypothetical protein